MLFVVYERFAGGVGPGAIRPFLVRMAITNALASAWWVVPVLVASRYGTNFLPFTEQPGTIWSTSSLSESLRLMGFWTSYVGVGFGGRLYPYASYGHAMLFHPPVVIASLLVPALALGGFVWTRRWRYGPWFLFLTLIGVLVMAAGFPEGTPLRRGLTYTYNHVHLVQFLRTTYKAGPLAALGLACLGGAAFAELWRRLRSVPLRGAAVAGCAALAALAAWPLASGRAPERQLALPDGVPAAWKAVAAELDRRGDGSRALSLPGQAFSHYRWGGTVDHVLTGLTEHPVATRYIVPFSDLRAAELQWAVDALISQERALPGQLTPLLRLLGVGDVVLGADGARGRSGEVSPAAAADVLAGQGLLAGGGCDDLPGKTCPTSSGRLAAGPRATAVRSYGPALTVGRPAGRLAGPARLPQVTDIRLPDPGIVQLLPRGPLTIVDGAAQGIVDLAGFDALPTDRPIAYAGDLDTAELRAAARTGANLVVTDSNRRQAFVSARLRGSRGHVLQAGENVSEDGVILDPVPQAGTDGETVAVLDGLRSIGAPFSPQVTQFPEHRPFAAIDGDLATSWLSDRALAPSRHRLDVAFLAAARCPVPRRLPLLRLAGAGAGAGGRRPPLRRARRMEPVARGPARRERDQHPDRQARQARARLGGRWRDQRAADPWRACERAHAPAAGGFPRAARRAAGAQLADLPVLALHRRCAGVGDAGGGRPAGRPAARPARP